MATYIFQVNLGIPYASSGVAVNASSGASSVTTYKYGSWPDVASNQSSIAAGNSAWIPINSKRDNKLVKHGDVFAASGTDGFYLSNYYTAENGNAMLATGALGLQSLTPPPPEGAILNILWQSNQSYRIPSTVLSQIQAANTVGSTVSTGVYGITSGTGTYTAVNTTLCTAIVNSLVAISDPITATGDPTTSGGSYGEFGGKFQHT